jgi:hypothetical protein
MILHDPPLNCEVGEGVLMAALLKSAPNKNHYAAFFKGVDGGAVSFSPFPGAPPRTFLFKEIPCEGGTDFGWVRVS